MLARRLALSPEELAAVADLERRVVAADGGRLKLEWGTLRTRDGDRPHDLLWQQDGELRGFLGLYVFGESVELAGMVAPAARRQGIGTALLDEALRLCRDLGAVRPLLVVPRPSAAGRAFALRHGGVLDHSEHALVLHDEPVAGPADPRTTVRPAVAADAPVVRRLLAAGFGRAPSAEVVARQLASPDERTRVVEHDGEPVGTVRLTRDGDEAGVYGFVVDPRWQGRGIGRDVLRRVCREARDAGARRTALEVAVDNDRALGLYASVGFRHVTTEDYWALDASREPSGQRV